MCGFQGSEQLGRFLYESVVMCGTAASGFNRSHFRNKQCRQTCWHVTPVSDKNKRLDRFRHGKCVVSKDTLAQKKCILSGHLKSLHGIRAVWHTQQVDIITFAVAENRTGNSFLQHVICQFLHLHYSIFKIFRFAWFNNKKCYFYALQTCMGFCYEFYIVVGDSVHLSLMLCYLSYSILYIDEILSKCTKWLVLKTTN